MQSFLNSMFLKGFANAELVFLDFWWEMSAWFSVFSTTGFHDNTLLIFQAFVRAVCSIGFRARSHVADFFRLEFLAGIHKILARMPRHTVFCRL